MNRQTKILIALTTTICMIMFAAGLKPKGFRFHNDVSRLVDQNGIRFGEFGIAYTDKIRPLSQNPAPESLTIELVIKVPKQHRTHLDVVFDLWDDRSPRHIALCQWDSTLMVMKTRSTIFEDGRSKMCKSVNTESVYFIAITSRRYHGTDLFINGIHATSTDRFDLCDSNASIGRLVVGNSPNANNPWQGELHAISIFTKVFSEAEIQERYQRWVAKQPVADSDAIMASYAFEENGGEIVHGHGGKLGDLHLPSIFFIPQKQILTMPWEDLRLNKSTALDVTMNLFGFIPFGIFFSALLWSFGGSARRYRLIITILVGGSISLFFELAQVYIPTRSSQMSDLILNIIGTIAGVIVASRILQFTKRAAV